jgi:hypothetical protein
MHSYGMLLVAATPHWLFLAYFAVEEFTAKYAKGAKKKNNLCRRKVYTVTV